MSGLDLTGVQRAVNDWLIDDLRISRDNGVADDQLDPETLLLIPTEGEDVWAGHGAIQPLTGFTEQKDPDVVRIMQETGARYRAMFPLGEVIPAALFDVLTVDALHSPSADPRLAGRSFSIVDFGGVSSFAVLQVLYLRPIGGDPAAPAPAP